MWSRNRLEKHSLDTRQFIDARQSRLPNGMRQLDVHNSSGLQFTILPDRGMDIWTATYNGLPLTWISQGSPHPPDYGSPWLRQFNGGLLTTCGLRNAGPAETDPETGEYRDVHGNFTRLRASDVSVQTVWQGDELVLHIRGILAEGQLFGEQLRVERHYRLVIGEPAFELTDTITNLYDEPVPLMVLYHFNIGYPLVQEGSQLLSPTDAVYPRDEAAQAGLETWNLYGAPQPGYAEQVFYHHVNADAEHWTRVALYNPDFGVCLGWDTTHAPYFSQWKNIRRGIYVCGIEPGNCMPEGQNAAREAGRLVILQPQASHIFTCRLTAFREVDETREKIDHLRTAGKRVENFKLGAN